MKKRFSLSEIGQFLVDKKQIQSFLGFYSYYKKIVQRFLSDNETIIFIDKLPLLVD